MGNQKTSKKARPEDCWDINMKEDAMDFEYKLLRQVRKYLSRAIRRANREYNERPELFWENLYCDCKPPKPSESGKRPPPIKSGKIRSCPPDPYLDLDFQALCKFLRFGENRDFPQGITDDSVNFYRYYGLIEKRDNFKNHLSNALTLRNQGTAHASEVTEAAYSRDKLEKAINTFKNLTEPLRRCEYKWKPEDLESVSAYWERVDQLVLHQFGAAPLSLQELGQELFGTDGDLTPEQEGQLKQIAEHLRLDVRDGSVYQEPSRDELLERMRRYLSKGELTQEAAQAVETEHRQAKEQREAVIHQVEEQERQLSSPLWTPIPPKESRTLRQAGSPLHMTENLLKILLDSFFVLVDESVFLSAEGRELLLSLRPMLAARHAKLPVDASVVSTIFRQFRTSTPYTSLELEEMEPDEREQMQQMRHETHQAAKTAIKALRHLREHGCLEVVSSPTDSRNSYENIAWLTRCFPQTRFLVLTMDRQLAEELAQLKAHNAVAAKPDLSGSLLFFRATRTIYMDMLQPDQTGAPPNSPPIPPVVPPAISPEIPARPAPSRPAAPSGESAGRGQGAALPVRRLPKQGEPVTARFGDGTTEQLQLGKFLNSGGEGSIYLTSRGELVAKIYLAKNLTQGRLEKLRHMVAADPKIPGLCWPCALLYNSLGEWVGLLMPKAEGKELATTVFTPGRDCCNIKSMGWSRRHLAAVAGNIAELFSRMHQSGILMGDVNPRNFMVRPDCTVYFVDCDSYQFGDFSCPVFSPLFLPPEVHRRMRSTPGGGSSSFKREPENELYSIAVLLFEVLFLGKAPYESRNGNNDDVIQAIIDGNFPYPYKGGDDEDEEPGRRSAMMAPVGRWRNIWSNLPYDIKTMFYSVFAQSSQNRPSAVKWAAAMRGYCKRIEEGKSNDELLPTKFKVVTERAGVENTKMVDFVCEHCGEEFNQSEDVMEKRRKHGEEQLCDVCRSRWLNFRKRAWPVRCDCCGKEYESNVAAWMEHDKSGTPLYCPSCSSMTVTCSRCRKTYTERREKVDRLREKGQEPLCPSCLQKMFTEVTCSECGATYQDRSEAVANFRRMGRPLLCYKCRSARRSRTT